MSAPSRINGRYLKSGTWSNAAYGEFQSHNFEIYNGSQGIWADTGSDGYSGFWFNRSSPISYKGTSWEHHTVVVTDANENDIYDSADYVTGYAYGTGSGTFGTWERNANEPYGSFGGGAFGYFEVTDKRLH